MSTDPTPTHDPAPRQGRRLARGLVMLGVSVVGLTTVVTGAFFTDSQDVGDNTFSTGTVDIGVSPASAVVTMANMAPGDTVTAELTVANGGTLAQRYSVLSTSDAADANFLAAQLQLTVKSGVTACTNAGFSATGTSVRPAGVLGSTAGTKVIGDAASGAQTGDRALATGANEKLCFQVSLPSSTGNSYQGKSTTASFRFDAEQTVNNP